MIPFLLSLEFRGRKLGNGLLALGAFVGFVFAADPTQLRMRNRTDEHHHTFSTIPTRRANRLALRGIEALLQFRQILFQFVDAFRSIFYALPKRPQFQNLQYGVERHV